MIGLIVPTLLLGRSIRGYLRTQAEVSVEATIQKLEYIGGKGSHTRVEYTYSHGGQNHVGTEVSLFGESGGLYPSLKAAHEGKQPIRVWIDPDDPSFAVIERCWQWGKILLGVPLFGAFAAVGVILIRCAWRGIA